MVANEILSFQDKVKLAIVKNLRAVLFDGHLREELLSRVIIDCKTSVKQAIKRAKKKGEKTFEVDIPYKLLLNLVNTDLYVKETILLDRDIFQNEHREAMITEYRNKNLDEKVITWATEYREYLRKTKQALEDYVFIHPDDFRKPQIVKFQCSIEQAEAIFQQSIIQASKKVEIQTELKARLLNKDGIILKETTVTPEQAEKLQGMVKGGQDEQNRVD